METLSATRESQRISLMGGEELCQMSDTFCSPYCSVSLFHSLSLSLSSSTPPPLPPFPHHIISLSLSLTPPHPPPRSSITQRDVSQAPCLENKLISLSPLSLSSLRTPPQKTLLVHLRPSIADRQYLCSLLIISLCGASWASRQEARPIQAA